MKQRTAELHSALLDQWAQNEQEYAEINQILYDVLQMLQNVVAHCARDQTQAMGLKAHYLHAVCATIMAKVQLISQKLLQDSYTERQITEFEKLRYRSS